MAEAFYAGAYWGPRGEPVDECAGRLSRLLMSWRELDPRLSSWFATGGSRTAALQRPVDPSVEALKELLAGRGRNESGLGFQASLWNGQEAEVGLSVRCGSPAAIAGMLSNALVLKLPPAQGEALPLYRTDTALGMVHSIVAAWQPSWCTWTSDRLRRAQNPKPGEVVAGWATYVAKPEGATHRVPEGVTAEPVGSGLLLVAEGQPVSTSEVTVATMRKALGSAVRPAT